MSTLQIQTPRAFQRLLEPGRYKGAFGGRGSGKSHFFAELLVERAITQDRLFAVCIREVQKTLKESAHRLISNKIQDMGVGPLFDVQKDIIKTPGGGQIIFQGMQNHTAESIKSLEGYHVSWVEEAQTLSQNSLKMLRPTMRGGAELWFSWNPRKDTDPVDVLLRGDELPPRSIVVEANYNDNPWFPDDLREEMEYDKRRDPDKYAHIWLGRYERNSEARVFKNWRVGSPEEFAPTPTQTFYFGADWGFSVDPTTLVRCYVDGRTLYVDREAYKIGCEIDHTPELFDAVLGNRKWTITADSARPETISYMRRQGFNVVPAVKGPGSVEDGVEFLKSYDIVVHPDCKHTVDELSLYRYQIDKQTDQVVPTLEDKDNHVIDALRYAIEPVRRRRPAFIATPLIITGARPSPGA